MKNYTSTNSKKIVRFNGGLGNQMFQWAFACSLADRYNAEIFFDYSYFEDVKKLDYVTSRNFELFAFNVDCKDFSKQDFSPVKKPEFKSKFKNSFAKLFPEIFGINYINEKQVFCFDCKILKHDYLCYEGYFQNEKYFKHLREKLLKDFSLKKPYCDLNEKNKAVMDELLNTNSVSLHIRRGDYVTLEYLNKIHGVCSIEYYQQAIKYIAQNVETPHFFVFSDDMDWVKENLKIDYPHTFMDFNQDKGYLDLELMKHCKHNICANSSFSWWGAWLNENSNKIVIAPKKWIAKKKKCDIIPKSWVKL